jgi:hypothetical protein
MKEDLLRFRVRGSGFGVQEFEVGNQRKENEDSGSPEVLRLRILDCCVLVSILNPEP